MSKFIIKMADNISEQVSINGITFPEFLNSEEKYQQCVQNTKTFKQFEKICYDLLDDEDLCLNDCLKIMTLLEHDITATHGNQDISCVMDVIEAIIHYHYMEAKNAVLRSKSERQELAQEEPKSNEKMDSIIEYDVCDCLEEDCIP